MPQSHSKLLHAPRPVELERFSTLSFSKRHARAVPLLFLFTMIVCPVVFNSLTSVFVVVLVVVDTWTCLEAKLL